MCGQVDLRVHLFEKKDYCCNMDTTNIHIAGSQAVQLMRMARKGDLVSGVPAVGYRIDAGGSSIGNAADLGIDGLLCALGINENRPLTLLVPNDAARCWRNESLSFIKTYTLSVSLPDDAFIELKPGRGRNAIGFPEDVRVFISGIGLEVIDGARKIGRSIKRGRMSELQGFLRVLEFVDECCGTYSRNYDNPCAGDVVYDEISHPTRFSDLYSLQSFLDKARHIDGLSLAHRAARYAIDGSGSPMETYINHALTLPPKYAGLSMHKPIVNQQLRLGSEDKVLLKHKSLRPDFQWPQYHMLAEYLGEKDHSSKSARVEDKNRMQDYAITPYAAFPLMFDDVKNAATINKTAEMLAGEFMRRGVRSELYRVRRLLKNEDFIAKQRVLVGTLLPPLKRYE